MPELLLKVIPLDLAATISPVLFAVAVVTLGSDYKPRGRVLAFFSGSLFVGIGVTLAGFALGKSVPADPKSSLLAAVIDLALGIILMFYAIRALVSKKNRERHVEKRGGHWFVSWFLIGLVMSVVNDSFFIIFAAAKEVGSAGVGSLQRFIFLLVNVFFFTIPITLPLSIYLIFPKLAGRILINLNHFVTKYSKYAIFAIFLIIAIVLIYRGFTFFI